MAWTDSVDLYCERVDPSFWSEPVNALTNVAFMVAGLWGLVQCRQRGAGPFAVLLSALVIAIGIGSFLFHTIATRWASLADVVPIGLFILAYVTFALRHLVGLPWPRSLAALAVGLLATMAAMSQVPPALARLTNGSIQYGPALAALALFSVVLARAGHPAWRSLATAAGVFVVSLVARTIDDAVCSGFPLGTHWIWHLLNAATLALLLRTAARA